MKRLLLLLAICSSLFLSACEFAIYEENPPRPVPPPPVVVVDARDAFLGYFDLEEYSYNFQATHFYEVNISKSSRPDNAIFISNFYCDGLVVEAWVNGNTFVIPEQYVGNYYITGSGNINGDRLLMDYNLIYDDGYAYFEDYAEATAYRIYF